MRIIVTGAGGFVGRHVLKELIEHDVVAIDLNLKHTPDTPNITKVEGDLRDLDVLLKAFQNGCDAVIHLATVPGGTAEIDSTLAKSVNVDATMALTDIAARTGECPHFVFASSIAVFGRLPSTPVIDDAPTHPTMLYGSHKLMMESWIATQTRRGEIQGISLRLPGIIARPKSPSGLKSAFLSDLFHVLREGKDFTIPVSRDATTWLCSVKTAAENIAFAATGMVKSNLENGPVLMPCQCVNVQELEQEIRRQLGSSPSEVRYSMDKELQSIFGEHPEVRTLKAQSMGFEADSSLKDLVKAGL
ncbi:MAG: NAD-dependent epimerase/dehydratase family protein [Litorimonas sp.]